MKKATSFLLALVMLVSMLPGAAVPAAAAETAAPTRNNYYSNIIVHETFDAIDFGMTKGKLGSTASRNYTVQVSGGAHIRTGIIGAEGNDEVAIANIDTLDQSLGFEVSFIADFNDLVVGGKAGDTDGFSVDVRAAQRCRYTFNADEAGNIFVTQYDGANHKIFDTGLDLPATDVDVRIVADDELNSSVLVNGEFVARFNAPAVTRPTGNYFVIYCGAENRRSDTRTNDVVLYDLQLSQGAAVADVKQAYYVMNPPHINGVTDEYPWAFEDGNRFALLSDENYLYVAVYNTDPSPVFIINGVSLTAEPTTGTVTTADGRWAGTAARTDSKTEVKIPLKSVLGLDYAPGQKVDFTYAWDKFTGAAVLASRAMVAYESFDTAVKDASAATAEVYGVQNGDGKLVLGTNTLTSSGASRYFLLKTLDTEDMDFGGGMTLEFTADFNDLIVPKTASGLINYNAAGNWGNAGFIIDLRMDPYHRYGFHADASGNIYVTQRMNRYQDVTRIDTGLDLGATGVKVKLVADAAGKTTVYINGTVLSSTLPVSTYPIPATGGRGYYQFYNSTQHRNGDTHKNNVTLYDVVLTQDVPAPRVVEYPMGGDANKDIKAYLNTSDIKMDGVPGEPEWYLGNILSATGKAPGGMIGFNWGGGNLYVGGETEADTVTMTIGGKKVSTNLKPVPATNAGELAVGGSGFEWIIPLDKFDLPDSVLYRQVTYTLTATKNGATSTLTGLMTFSGEKILFGDPGSNYTAKEYASIKGQGHVTWARTDDGVAITHEGITDPKGVGGSFGQQRLAVVDYDSGAYNLEVTLTINQLPAIADVIGQRGLMFQVWSDEVQGPVALYNDGKDNVMLGARFHYGDQSCDTGLNIGDTATIRLEVDAKHIPTLYVDGKLVKTFTPFDRRNVNTQGQPTPNFIINPQNASRKLNDDGTLDAVDVVLHNVLLTQTPFMDAQSVVDAALKQMDEAFVVAGGDTQDVTALNLPKRLLVDTVNVPVSVSWSALDKLTGRIPLGVNLNTGAITKGAEAQAFELKAYVSYEGASGTKTFLLQSEGSSTSANKVALIVDDANPATGAATEWTGSRYAYFDTTHNSIVLDQGSSRAFNRIVLRDSDEYSRVSARHLGVFVSNDNVNYTKVTGWLLHQDGRTYTLYNLNETARYVKVHTYHDDLDITGEQPTFYNLISDMLKVSNEKTLPGAGGKFAHTATFNADNSTGVEKYDTPVFVSLAQLGATAGQYKDGCPDFRFTVDETTLAHWYNGNDGFYVRVPSIPANGSTTITAHWGCSSAQNYSDGETTFEVTYGNVALIDLSKETYEIMGKEGMSSHGRPFTFPNGDVIVVGRQISSDADLAVYRSTDGGHTFSTKPVLAYDDSNYKGRGSGFGGFLWDESIGDKGRLYLVGYNGKVGDATDYRLMLTHTDDWGYTWSDTTFLNLPGSELIQRSSSHPKGAGNADYVELQNSGVRTANKEIAKRAITYTDALTMKDADGTGPNVDYVIVHGDTVYDNPDGLAISALTEAGGAKGLRDITTAVYSTDGGQSWICSDTMMFIPGLDLSRNAEDGLSEAGFAQLDDGSLYLVMRAQQDGNYYFHEGLSTDFGKTWTYDYGRHLASNTAPALTKYGNDRLMTWAACNGLGQISYRRTPMHVGISSDEYQTFDKILDMTFGTSFDSLRDAEQRMTQVGIAISPDGKDAFFSFFDHSYFYHVWDESMYNYVGTVGFLVEDFDRMIRKTKGAWDDFEDSSLKFQGWLCERDGTIMLTREQSVSGKQSMKVLDENMGAPTHALRQIPSMKSGTVGAKLMVPKTNESEFVMELKAAYNYTHMKHTVAAFSVTPSGTVYVWDGSNKVAVTTVPAGGWNDYALTYDVNTGKGVLFVNGTQAGGEFTLPGASLEKDIDLVHGVTAVSFNQVAATEKNGDCLYVDDFYVTEMATMSRTVEANDPVPTLLGRFMAIVRKVIEVNGEKVQIVEWGWVPGL